MALRFMPADTSAAACTPLAPGPLLKRSQNAGPTPSIERCTLSSQRDEFHRDLIYIGHAAALKDDLSALENLLSACLLGGQRPATPILMQALAAAGLRQREHLSARSLSQGQRRRVALARLLLEPAPPLWVLDEPFNALDAVASDWLLGVLTGQLRRGGIVVLTSHQPVAIDPSLSQVTLAL